MDGHLYMICLLTNFFSNNLPIFHRRSKAYTAAQVQHHTNLESYFETQSQCVLRKWLIAQRVLQSLIQLQWVSKDYVLATGILDKFLN